MTQNIYQAPQIKSSFCLNNLGETLYASILLLKPVNVFELGTLGGYSTVCILQALRRLGQKSALYSYDLFDRYPFNHVTLEEYNLNLHAHSSSFESQLVSHYVEQRDILGTINEIGDKILTSEFPLVFVDISNTAEIIESIICSTKRQVPILFEGGTEERDNVSWVRVHNKQPISLLKARGISYQVIDHSFPGISLFFPDNYPS